MTLGERIKLLRKERGWSQGELAEKIGADARQISRYENGRITPSVEVIVKIAQTFDVSIDYLLVEEVPRRPLRLEDQGFLDRLQDISRPSPRRTGLLCSTSSTAFLAKNKVKALARGLG